MSQSEDTKRQLEVERSGLDADETLEGSVLGPQSLQFVLHVLEVLQRESYQDLSRTSHLQVREVGVAGGRVLAVAHRDGAAFRVHLVLDYNSGALI